MYSKWQEVFPTLRSCYVWEGILTEGILAESIVSEKVFFRKRYFVLDLEGIMTGNPFRQLATTNCSKNVQCPYLCRDSGLLDLNLPDFLAEVVQFPTWYLVRTSCHDGHAGWSVRLSLRTPEFDWRRRWKMAEWSWVGCLAAHPLWEHWSTTKVRHLASNCL